MSNVGRIMLVLAIGASAGCRDRQSAALPQRYELGRTATTAAIAALDIDAAPDGAGLPQGTGTPSEGAAIYAAKCASCHGAKGEGQPPVYPQLVGRDSADEGFQFARDGRRVRTIGNYWPYATSVFDYIRRTMPQMSPGSLTNTEVYALTAYLLAANDVIPLTTRLDSASLVAVKMPYADRFVRDDRKGSSVVK